MNARAIGWAVLAAAAAAQWAVVGTVVVTRETVERTGEIVRFAMAIFDPADAFRGRYLALNVPFEIAPAPPGSWKPGESVWVSLERDDRGVARPTGLSRTAPSSDLALKGEIHDADDERILLRSLFQRFYMNERQAPRAKKLLGRRGATNAVLVARVRKGLAVPVDIELEGRSLSAWLAGAADAAP